MMGGDIFSTSNSFKSLNIFVNCIDHALCAHHKDLKIYFASAVPNPDNSSHPWSYSFSQQSFSYLGNNTRKNYVVNFIKNVIETDRSVFPLQKES